MTEQQKPVKRIDSLSALQPETVDVTMEFEDHIEVMPLKTLSYAEWQRIGWSVPNPTPPISGVDGNKRPIVNYDDPQFRIQVQQAELERAYRRVLASMVLPVPGNTEAEQLDYLKALDANRIRMLINAVSELAAGGGARIGAKAQFPVNGGASAGKGVPADR